MLQQYLNSLWHKNVHGVRTRYFHSSFMLGVYIKTSVMQFTLQTCKMCLANSEDGIGEEKSLILLGFFLIWCL